MTSDFLPNAETIAKKVILRSLDEREYSDDIVLAEGLLKAIEALETYAQIAKNGETTFIAGALAQAALSAIRGRFVERELFGPGKSFFDGASDA